MSTIRITKSQKYNAAIALLEGKEPVVISKDGNSVTLDGPYLCKFFNEELKLLTKKNTSGGTKKLTKTQEKNNEFKGIILSFLTVNPSLVMSATDVMEKVLRPAYPAEVWSNQRVASLLNAMADKYDKDGVLIDDTGKLYKVIGKGKNKTTFQIKPEYAAEANDESAE